MANLSSPFAVLADARDVPAEEVLWNETNVAVWCLDCTSKNALVRASKVQSVFAAKSERDFEQQLIR